MTTTKTGIPQKFWNTFLLNTWQRECLSIKDSFIHPLINPDELLSLIVDNWNLDDDLYKRSRFYIEGKRQKLKKTSLLWPQKEDKSFYDYNQRIQSIINVQEYVLIIDGLKVNGTLWDWTYDFLQNLYKSLGYLNVGHFYSIFYGNYKATPFGVHDDPNTGAFYFPIIGQKSIRTWTPEFVNRHPKLKKAREYKEFLEGSTLLEAESGGMLYWPSDRWHIGESKGGDVSIVLATNISNNFVQPLLNFVCDEIQAVYGNSLRGHLLKIKTRVSIYWSILYEELHFLYKDSFQKYFLRIILKLCNIIISTLLPIKPHKEINTKAFFNPDNLQESAEQIPEPIHLAAATFEGTVDSSILEQASIKLWLAGLTSYGFYPLSESQFGSLNEELTLDNYIQLFPKRTILWKQVNKNEMIVSVNGLCFSVSSNPIFQNLIKNINSQKIQSIEQLVKISSKIAEGNNIIEYSLEEVLKFLEILLRYRGIQTIKQENCF
ncbi:hypothetical protein BZZ01_09615 [Nostocales cyanobacterium HT-58-2]|nr:hypothetical protein BZZ01_09615 [Nostocales cyanobacterium HT-58-2]